MVAALWVLCGDCCRLFVGWCVVCVVGGVAVVVVVVVVDEVVVVVGGGGVDVAVAVDVVCFVDVCRC